MVAHKLARAAISFASPHSFSAITVCITDIIPIEMN